MYWSFLFNDWTTVWIFLLTLILVVYLKQKRYLRRLPPGPLALPVVGNILNLAGKDLLEAFRQLRKKYGDIYRIYIGQELTIVFNGYNAIHAALVKKGSLFQFRPITPFMKNLVHKQAIVFANGQIWKEHRALGQRALQEFGFATTGMTIEDRINEEVNEFIDSVEKVEGPFDIQSVLARSICNIINGIVLGQRSHYEDADFKRLVDLIHIETSFLGKLAFVLNAFPFITILSYLPGDLLKFRRMKKLTDEMEEFYAIRIKQHLQSFEEHESIRDFIDFSINEMKVNERRGKDSTLSEDTLLVTCQDMFGAGTETSATTIRWMLLYILKNPIVQTKLHQEIDETIGKDKQPSLCDRSRMTYVEATIMETLRMANPAPLSIPHTVPYDIVFNGFLIPANTSVLFNLDSATKDPEAWTDPDVFRPERFLKENGSLHAPKEFIPFSLGRRSCLGESLARMELFLYVTRLLQTFEIQQAPDDVLPDTCGILGITYTPKPYRIVLVKR